MPLTRSLRAKSCLCTSSFTLAPILDYHMLRVSRLYLDVEPHAAGWPSRKGPVLPEINAVACACRCRGTNSASVDENERVRYFFEIEREVRRVVGGGYGTALTSNAPLSKFPIPQIPSLPQARPQNSWQLQSSDVSPRHTLCLPSHALTPAVTRNHERRSQHGQYRTPSTSMKLLTLFATALLAATASARSSLLRSSIDVAPYDDALKVPGENPLQHCQDPKDDILELESVDLDPNPPLP